jgi:hypothetical protein
MMMKSRQRGAFLMARALLIVGILTAMLVIPVYLKKEREEREAAVHKAEWRTAKGRGLRPLRASGVHSDVAPAARAIGHGLTFVVTMRWQGAARGRAPELPWRARHAGSAPPGIVQPLPGRHLLPHGSSRSVRPPRGGAFARRAGCRRLSGLDRRHARRDPARDGGCSGVCGPGVGPLRKGTGRGLANGRVSRRPGRPRQLGASGSAGSRPDGPYPLLGPYRRPEGQLLGQRRVAADGFT